MNIAFVIFPAAMIAAGFSDIFARTIPNLLIATLSFGFIALAPLAGLGSSQIALHLLAGSLALMIGFGCFAAGWIGGGDGKLLAVTALWLGPAAMPDYLVYSALIGGVLSLAVLMVRTVPLPAVLYGYRWTSQLQAQGASVPYGVALAVGGVLAMGASPWLGAA